MGKITVPANTDYFEEVLNFAENAMRDAGLDKKTQNNINTAIEEIFVNISSYAYPSNEGKVTVFIYADQDMVIAEFHDEGTPYDPLAKADPDTTLSADEREIGGLGIFMVKKLMDEVRYEHRDGCNILTISKNV